MTMNCTVFDEQLADYLEGDLGAAERHAVQTHLASCVRCTALVRDLQQISADAGDLAELSPSRDLWADIAKRIDTPVVPLVPRTMPNVAARQRAMDRLRLAAVAAALVAVTAGVTYTLTVSRAPNPGEAVANARPDSVSTPSAAQRTAPVQQTVANADTAIAQPDGTPGASSAPAAQSVGNASAATTYSREIDRLRTIFTRNQAQLDPRTTAIIEANLKVIDEAIAQSKAALEQDPASRFLNNQLNSALDKKLELLRTAAMLPNRT
jgi:anti-sigma factor RsiW